MISYIKIGVCLLIALVCIVLFSFYRGLFGISLTFTEIFSFSKKAVIDAIKR